MAVLLSCRCVAKVNAAFVARKVVLSNVVFTRCSKKLKGLEKMSAQVMQKIDLEVETDPHKLVNFLCGANISKDEEEIKLKPDDQYPEWLWSLHINREPLPLSELDPKDAYYWRRLKKMNLHRKNKLMKLKKF